MGHLCTHVVLNRGCFSPRLCHGRRDRDGRIITACEGCCCSAGRQVGYGAEARLEDTLVHRSQGHFPGPPLHHPYTLLETLLPWVLPSWLVLQKWGIRSRVWALPPRASMLLRAHLLLQGHRGHARPEPPPGSHGRPRWSHRSTQLQPSLPLTLHGCTSVSKTVSSLA